MSEVQRRHWTEDSPEDFIHKIVGDFVRFIENAMGDSVSQSALAARIGVSDGRVSQVLNNPGNLSLKTIVQFARALGAKVSIVGYHDDDAQNVRGPVPAEVFAECWARDGKPRDYYAVSQCEQKVVYLPFMADALLTELKINKQATTPADYFTGKRVTTVSTPSVTQGN